MKASTDNNGEYYKQLLSKATVQKYKISEDVASIIAGDVVDAFFHDLPTSPDRSIFFSEVLRFQGIIEENETERFRQIYKQVAEDFDFLCCSIH